MKLTKAQREVGSALADWPEGFVVRRAELSDKEHQHAVAEMIDGGLVKMVLVLTEAGREALKEGAK